MHKGGAEADEKVQYWLCNPTYNGLVQGVQTKSKTCMYGWIKRMGDRRRLFFVFFQTEHTKQ